MEFLDTCPSCGKALQLQQINFKMAVFICVDVKCPYPCFTDCLVVKRNLENIKKPIDLREELRKQEWLPSTSNCTTNLEQFSESSLLLDLEHLLSSQSSFLPDHEELLDKDNSNSDIKKVENYQPSDQSLGLPELDQFLIDLLP